MKNNFKWCGYTWQCDMKGRIIHSDTPYMWYGKDDIRIVDGDIIELGIRRNPRDVDYKGKTYHPEYETSVIRTLDAFGYGEFSADIKLPEGVGLWPSFWLSGSCNWPPEIDIMESWSSNCDYYKFPWHKRITTNVHYNEDLLINGSNSADRLVKSDIGSKNLSLLKVCKDFTGEFVNYRCRWSEDSIEFYVNNKLIRSVDKDVCHKLTANLKDPDKGFMMDAIFDLWIDDPGKYNIKLNSVMAIKNFKYNGL